MQTVQPMEVRMTGALMGAIVCGGMSAAAPLQGAIVGGGLSHGPAERAEPLWLSVEVGEHCPLTCRHCIYESALDRRAGAPIPAVQAAIFEHVQKLPFRPAGITFAGKEPTAYPQELKWMATALAGHRLILVTNGLNVERVLATGIPAVDISIDGDEPAHNHVRGPGTFSRTMNTVRTLLRAGRRVGVVATAMNTVLPDGRPQTVALGALAQYLRAEFGDQVNFSVSLYYGRPGDPMILMHHHLSSLREQLHVSGLPTRVLWTALYGHEADAMLENLPTAFDLAGVPMVMDGQLCHLVFHRALQPLVALRIARDGAVYAGCNHLTYPAAVRQRLAIGNVLEEPLGETYRKLLAGKTWLGSLPSVPGFGHDGLTAQYEQVVA